MDQNQIQVNADQYQRQLQGLFSAMKDSLSQEHKEEFRSLVLETETLGHKVALCASKKDFEPLEKRMNEIAESVAKIMSTQSANQTVIDNYIKEQKGRIITPERKTFSSQWEEDVIKPLMAEKEASAEMFKKSKAKLEFSLKTPTRLWTPGMEEKAIMTTANTLTGTGYITFNERPGILPPQKINFRDLLSTAMSANGSYVTYRETNAVQAVGKQTEGSAKQNMQYTFQANTATLSYIAGFVTFTKQLLYNLEFLQNRLPTMLLRDFYKKENDYFFTTIAGNSTGANPPTVAGGATDAEELIQVIANQRKANFEASYAIIDWTEWGRLLATKPNDYSIPGGVTIDANGTMRIAGVPVIAASWAQTDHVLVYDYDYYERVEGESLRVEFSYENQDNFEKNQITARIECFEEINRLRDDASIYHDFGNS